MYINYTHYAHVHFTSDAYFTRTTVIRIVRQQLIHNNNLLSKSYPYYRVYYQDDLSTTAAIGTTVCFFWPGVQHAYVGL